MPRLLRDLHRNSEALPLLERAAAYLHSAPAPPKLAIVLRNLAELIAARGETARAEDLFHQSLLICDQSLPLDHPQIGIILEAYARFLSQTRRKKESAGVNRRANAILNTAPRQSGAAYTVDASSFARQ